jgi:hypothetical protein
MIPARETLRTLIQRAGSGMLSRSLPPPLSAVGGEALRAAHGRSRLHGNRMTQWSRWRIRIARLLSRVAQRPNELPHRASFEHKRLPVIVKRSGFRKAHAKANRRAGARARNSAKTLRETGGVRSQEEARASVPEGLCASALVQAGQQNGCMAAPIESAARAHVHGIAV